MLLPLIGEGWDGEYPVRGLFYRHSEQRSKAVRDSESSSLGTMINYSTPFNSSNYATLNQLCIQAHSSSLRCGGSLCKVQSDKKMRHSGLRAGVPCKPRLALLRNGGVYTYFFIFTFMQPLLILSLHSVPPAQSQ